MQRQNNALNHYHRHKRRAGTGVTNSGSRHTLTNLMADDSMSDAPAFFPDLLEQFMNTYHAAERWTTVQEFRTSMSLDTSTAHAISGFFRRLYNNPSVACRYTVVRIENIKVSQPYRRIIRRYLVREKVAQRYVPDPVKKKYLKHSR
ncbi:MAG TPA: hypothetical protein PKM50_07025 [Methanoregula sp.]|nr:hypothetical protein [Methanoregula sp.]